MQECNFYLYSCIAGIVYAFVFFVVTSCLLRNKRVKFKYLEILELSMAVLLALSCLVAASLVSLFSFAFGFSASALSVFGRLLSTVPFLRCDTQCVSLLLFSWSGINSFARRTAGYSSHLPCSLIAGHRRDCQKLQNLHHQFQLLRRRLPTEP